MPFKEVHLTAGESVSIFVEDAQSVGVHVVGTFTGSLTAHGVTGATDTPFVLTLFDRDGNDYSSITSAGVYAASATAVRDFTLTASGDLASAGGVLVAIMTSAAPASIVVSGGGGGGGGDASAANQTSVQAVAGSDASKAVAVQGLTNGKPFNVSMMAKVSASYPTYSDGDYNYASLDLNGLLRVSVVGAGGFTVPAASTTSGQVGILSFAACNTFSPTYVDGKSYPLSVTTGGYLRAVVAAGEGLGDYTETAPASDTASSGLNGRLQRIAQRISSLIALLPTALGQTTKAASLPVVLPSDQIIPSSIDQTTVGTTDSVTVKASAGIGSLTETAPASDTASSGLNGRLQRIAQRLTSLIGLLPTTLGQTTKSASFPVVLPSDQIVTLSTMLYTDDNLVLFFARDIGTTTPSIIFYKVSDNTAYTPVGTIVIAISPAAATAAKQTTLQGAVGTTSDTAPASDTATASLNGRLQRVAQRITSLIALLPTALGQTTKTASLSVAVASDQVLDTAPRTRSVSVSVTPTVTASSAYTAGNEVGGLMTFANVVTSNALSGILESIKITSKTVQTGALKLYLFNANPSNSTWTDKSAPAINAADVASVIGVYFLSVNDSGLGTHTIYNLDGIGKQFAGATTSLWGVLVTSATPTWGSTSDVIVTLGVLQD